MENAVMEPELKEVVDSPVGEDGGDEDKPGWLVHRVGLQEPVIVFLEGTDHEGMSTEEVFAAFEKVCLSGGSHFRLGNWCGAVSAIIDIAWSDDVDFPRSGEIGEVADAIEQIEGRTSSIEQGILAILAGASSETYDDEDDEDDEDEVSSVSPMPALGKFPGSGGGPLPPGFRRS